MSAADRNNPRKAKSSDSTYSVMDFVRDFPDDATCLDWLWRRLYSTDGVHAECPKCETERGFHRVKSRPSYSCDSCGHHIHPTAGTIFHKSSTSLQLWFHAIYLMSSTRCGISAKQLEREIGVTYKTAWRMFHRIRVMLMSDDGDMLDGEVEVDETYVGGKRRGAPRGRPGPDSHKTAVLGMAQRQGKVVAKVVPDTSKATVLPEVRGRILDRSMIYTDEYVVYGGLSRMGYQHERVHHSAKVYVSGNAHTNTIEGFWALVKNGIRGVHHAVSAKYLQGYLDEYAFRHNHRDNPQPLFLTLLGRICRVGTA
jgi:transposase-like protein